MEAGGVPVTHCRRCNQAVWNVPISGSCPHCGGLIFRNAEEVARLRASFDAENAAEEGESMHDGYCIDPVGKLARWLADNGHGVIETYRQVPISYCTRQPVAIGLPCYVRSQHAALAADCQDRVILVKAP